MNYKSLFLLSSICFFILTEAQSTVSDLQNCKQTSYVRNFYDPSNYIEICIECNDQYVLSFDFLKCLNSNLLDSRLVFCKRLSNSGWCDEAQCTLQITTEGNIVSKLNGHPNENCAIFDASTGNCVRPRFGFTLNKQTGVINKDQIHYCTVKDGNNCLEYFGTFIPQTLDQYSTYSVFLSSFSNPEQLENIQSQLTEIKCKDGYQIQILDFFPSIQYYGCVPINYSVNFCQSYDQYSKLCIKCFEGFSIDLNGKSCLQKVNKCSVHTVYQSIVQCVTCDPMYYLENGNCYHLEHCIVQHQDSYCGYCQFPYFGQKCESINQNVEDLCELLNRKGNCVQCSDNQKYFYHIFNQVCQLREHSNECKVKNTISDQCSTFDCEDGYYFNVTVMEPWVYSRYQHYSCSYIQNNLWENEYSWWTNWWKSNEAYENASEDFKGINDFYYFIYYFQKGYYQQTDFCTLRTQTQIDHCVSYDNCFESCSKCEDGYSLIQRSDLFTDFYNRFICTPTLTTPIIDNCATYSPDFQYCAQCENYYTNYQYSCSSGTIQNCKTYGDWGYCSICESNYLLINNQCFYVELCSQYEILGWNVYCKKCVQKPDVTISLVESSNGFRADCIQNLPSIKCSHFIDDVCVLCSTGYTLIKETNSCVSETNIEDFCLIATQDNLCTDCITGYRLVSGKCVKVNGSCTLRQTCDTHSCKTNCEGVIIQDSKTCQFQCPIGEGLFSGSCLPCSNIFGEGCSSCNSSKYCEKCDDQYHWCPDQKICRYTCPNGIVVDSKYQCSTCTQQNCVSCSYSQCLQCGNDYYLQDNQCVQQCSSDYQVSSNYSMKYCYKCEENCTQCTPYGPTITECVTCVTGKYLRQGKCENTCGFFQYNGQCTDVCDKFLLNETKCVEECPLYYQFSYKYISTGYFSSKICIDDCKEYTYSTGEDLKLCDVYCKQGYFQNQETKKCEKCKDINCNSCWKSSDQCDWCQYGYSQKNGSCWYVCPGNNKLVKEPSECNQCLVQGCETDCSLTGKCTKCLDNFILESSQKCKCPEEIGFFFDYNSNECKKCDIEGCSQCNSNGSCSNCLYSYYKQYNYYTGQLECLKECKEGWYHAYGYCQKCPDHCTKCNGWNSCSSCEDGYSPVKYSNNASDTTQQKYVQCFYKCPDGSKVDVPGKCSCSDKNCDECSDNPFQCDTCKNFFDYNPVLHKCGFVNTQNCSVHFCSKCSITDSSLCQTCIEGYKLSQGKCLFVCPTGQLASCIDECISDVTCLVDNCQQCDDTNPNVCITCNSSFYWSQGNCVQICPNRYFLNENMICEQCDIHCETCTSKDFCTSCKNPNAPAKSCECPVGFKLYKNTCIKKCPLYSTLIGESYCLEHCASGLFPVFTANREQRICEIVESESNSFCLQNIENIPQIVTFSLNPISNLDSAYYLNIIFESIPSTCYVLKLEGAQNNYFEVNLSSETDLETAYVATIPKDFVAQNLMSCTDLQCKANLQIYLFEELQFLIEININFDINLVISNGISYKGAFSTFSGVCSTCSIPQSLVISSSATVKCPDNQICNSQVIQTTTNSQVSVTLVVQDPKFVNNKLQPHSIKIEYLNSLGVLNTLLITNYYYDNSVLGQITFTFNAIALRSGNLILTAVCNKANVVTRLLSASNQQSSEIYSYPQFQIGFLFEDSYLQYQKASEDESFKPEETQNNKSNNNNITYIIIAATLGGTIIMILSAIIFYKYFFSKKEQKQLNESEKSVFGMVPIESCKLSRKNSELVNHQTEVVSSIQKEELAIQFEK